MLGRLGRLLSRLGKHNPIWNVSMDCSIITENKTSEGSRMRLIAFRALGERMGAFARLGRRSRLGEQIPYVWYGMVSMVSIIK